MPLFSKSSSSSNGTASKSNGTDSSGIGSSNSSSSTTTKKEQDGSKSNGGDATTTRPEGIGDGVGTTPKSFGGGTANLNVDGSSDFFSPSGTFCSLNDGTSPLGTTTSKMSSSFNQSSSYNRTFERKVIEESTPTMTTRMFTSSPLNTIKTTLSSGGGFPADLGAFGTGGTSFVQPHNYQFGTATSGSFQSSDDSLSVSMDCAAFAPEELKVSVVGNQIVVEGKHGEKQDALGTIERHFVRKFALPRNATADSVNSNLTSDGMLTVTASAPKAKDNSPIRTIPVKIVTTTSAGGGGQQQQQNGGGQFQQNGQ